ncbi:MAG: molybdopterin oxidoreductase [Firmicutes bacterium HGW-Firmicutes-7]|nr:MAG: molybdopterin oxidoreductase [Firmicutes bacterium HGW-Firmicutes-7]
MEKISYTCIVCPKSCKGELIVKDNNEFETSGYICKRGIEYAINEYRSPKRMLTTTVKMLNGTFSNLPVVSDNEVDKDKLFACLNYLYSTKLEAPIKEGDIIVANILNTGVNIIAARDMKIKS